MTVACNFKLSSKASFRPESALRGLFCCLLLALAFHAGTAFASRPGGGSEGPDQCTVMGEVTALKENNMAVVRLKEIAGSTTQNGCNATGAAKMAAANTAVSVPIDIQPAPTIVVGDVVFVNVRSDTDVSLETFAPGDFTMNQLLQEIQIFFDNRVERYQIVYAVRTFIGVQHVIDELVPKLINETGEKRLSAALMLILLADNKQPVPPDALQQALRIGLMESRQSAVGSSIRLYPGDKAQTVNVLIGILHDKEVVDPFATIVAIGEMGEEGQRAIPDAIDRINEPNLSQMRDDGDKIFATAVEKTKAGDKAAEIFMSKVKEGKLKDKEGPLAKGMCRLHTDNADLNGWCHQSGATPKTCEDAVAKMNGFLESLSASCKKDEDCDSFYFPIGGPACHDRWFLPTASVTEAVKATAEKLEAVVHASCSPEWQGKSKDCVPIVSWHPICDAGKCANLKD